MNIESFLPFFQSPHLEVVSEYSLGFLELWCGKGEPWILILAHLFQLQNTVMSVQQGGRA